MSEEQTTLHNINRRMTRLEERVTSAGEIEDRYQRSIHGLREHITTANLKTEASMRRHAEDVKRIGDSQETLLTAIRSVQQALEAIQQSTVSRDAINEHQGDLLVQLTERVNATDRKIDRFIETATDDLKKFDKRMDGLESLIDDTTFRLVPMTSYFYGDETRPSFFQARETELRDLATMKAQSEIILAAQAERELRAKQRREQMVTLGKQLWNFVWSYWGATAISTATITITQLGGVIDWKVVPELFDRILKAIFGG